MDLSSASKWPEATAVGVVAVCTLMALAPERWIPKDPWTAIAAVATAVAATIALRVASANAAELRRNEARREEELLRAARVAAALLRAPIFGIKISYERGYMHLMRNPKLLQDPEQRAEWLAALMKFRSKMRIEDVSTLAGHGCAAVVDVILITDTFVEALGAKAGEDSDIKVTRELMGIAAQAAGKCGLVQTYCDDLYPERTAQGSKLGS